MERRLSSPAHALLTETSSDTTPTLGITHWFRPERRWYYSGQHSTIAAPPWQLTARSSTIKIVVCNQNHDQVGNRAAGERLTSLVSFEALKLAAESIFSRRSSPAIHGRVWRDRAFSILHQSRRSRWLKQSVGDAVRSSPPLVGRTACLTLKTSKHFADPLSSSL